MFNLLAPLPSSSENWRWSGSGRVSRRPMPEAIIRLERPQLGAKADDIRRLKAEGKLTPSWAELGVSRSSVFRMLRDGA